MIYISVTNWFILLCILFELVLYAAMKHQNCSTGSIKNELSNDDDWICCDRFCEDKSSSFYNLDQCCLFAECHKHYVDVCANIEDDSSDLISGDRVHPIPKVDVSDSGSIYSRNNLDEDSNESNVSISSTKIQEKCEIQVPFLKKSVLIFIERRISLGKTKIEIDNKFITIGVFLTLIAFCSMGVAIAWWRQKKCKKFITKNENIPYRRI